MHRVDVGIMALNRHNSLAYPITPIPNLEPPVIIDTAAFSPHYFLLILRNSRTSRVTRPSAAARPLLRTLQSVGHAQDSDSLDDAHAPMTVG